MKPVLTYDGSFEGLLCAIFYVYEASLTAVDIKKKEFSQPSFFDTSTEIHTETDKAKRVWKAILKKATKGTPRFIYKAFLSEQLEIENNILHLVQRIIYQERSPEKDYTDRRVLQLAKTVKMVDREKHRMDAFVRFRLTKEGVYMATIAPDFNVLPLNASHFQKRYADQKWLIYDLKRNYGIFYDLDKIATISLELNPKLDQERHQSLFFTSEELAFEDLWKNYFRSTNIKERKNMKLHIRHVPKRYWKYLSEITEN